MYPDYAFYLTVFGGSEEEDIIMPYIKRSLDTVLGAVIYPDDGGSRRAVFMAACAQGEHELRTEYSSVKLGDFSASVRGGSGICPAAAGFLEKAGLLYRGGVGCSS